jgi:hypothetical protein
LFVYYFSFDNERIIVHTSLRAALIVLGATLLAGNAAADDYSILIGEAHTGSSIPRTKVGLGIKVGVDKSWDQLSPEERQEWREFTDLLQPEVIPPFPVPNIRGFLRKLTVPSKFEYTEDIERKEGLYLIVRISDKGDVTTVDIMEATTKEAKTLTDNEKILAYRYVTALLATKFSPATLNGQAMPCAFPMRISSTTHML